MINNPTLNKEVKTVYCLYRVSTRGQKKIVKRFAILYKEVENQSSYCKC